MSLQINNKKGRGMAKESDLCACIRRMLTQYIRDLDGESPAGVYDMVINSVEKPMIEMVLRYAEGNQTRAAEILGINRNTLRKKMNELGIA
jgi:Fis family transcriptional regulator, factor for inversion stimulation protein